MKIAFSPHLLETHCIVDARTPLEFAEDHLPGAYNVPILTNEERVEIGILHKEQGPQPARMRALELTCGRYADMVHQAAAHAVGRPILVYCWRGGLRSYSLSLLLEMCGYNATQLAGGYRAFRNHVNACFESFAPPSPLIIIHGMTGTGKTAFINRINPEKYSVIDLEGMACHRGSAFGALGLSQDMTQKRFDTLLWDAFRTVPPDRPIILEGESQRIGRYFLPGNLYQVMSQSIKVWCSASLETRIKRLSTEYAREEFRQPMAMALERIRKKLGGEQYAAMKRLLECWDTEGVARGLIEYYYDKLYYRNRPWTPDAEIDLEDFVKGEKQLETFCISSGISLPAQPAS